MLEKRYDTRNAIIILIIRDSSCMYVRQSAMRSFRAMFRAVYILSVTILFVPSYNTPSKPNPHVFIVQDCA